MACAVYIALTAYLFCVSGGNAQVTKPQLGSHDAYVSTRGTQHVANDTRVTTAAFGMVNKPVFKPASVTRRYRLVIIQVKAHD